MTAAATAPADRTDLASLGLRTSYLPAGTEVHGPADLPLHADGARAVFRLWYLAAGPQRYIAAVLGDLTGSQPVLLRIESACAFGHVFGSGQCDCGWQWRTALRDIIGAGRGLLIYGVDQDARGLGLAAHFDIYRMRQQDDLDTEQVFKALDAPWDNRDYAFIPPILRALAVSSVALLSNNAARLAMLREAGFAVVRQPLEAQLTTDNMSTLMLEKEDLGYSWSFLTHADILADLQASVADQPELTAVTLAAPGRRAAVARRAPSDDVPPTVAQMAQPLPMPERTVLYLTDLPRLDELPSYAALGIEVVVVPYPVLPRLLRAAARAAGLRLVDWSRRNAWHRPRPQWVPRAISATIHYYQRDHCGIGPPADDQPVRLVRRTLADTGTPTWHVVPGVTTPAAGWPGCHDADDESALETVVAGWTVAEGASR